MLRLIFLTIISFSALAESGNYIDCLSEKYRSIENRETEGSTWKKYQVKSENDLSLYSPNYGSNVFNGGQFEFCNTLNSDQIHHLQLLEGYILCDEAYDGESCKSLEDYFQKLKNEYLEEYGTIDDFIGPDEITALKVLFSQSDLKTRINRVALSSKVDEPPHLEMDKPLVTKVEKPKPVSFKEPVALEKSWLLRLWNAFIAQFIAFIEAVVGIFKLFNIL